MDYDDERSTIYAYNWCAAVPFSRGCLVDANILLQWAELRLEAIAFTWYILVEQGVCADIKNH